MTYLAGKVLKIRRSAFLGTRGIYSVSLKKETEIQSYISQN